MHALDLVDTERLSDSYGFLPVPIHLLSSGCSNSDDDAISCDGVDAQPWHSWLRPSRVQQMRTLKQSD